MIVSFVEEMGLTLKQVEGAKAKFGAPQSS